MFLRKLIPLLDTRHHYFMLSLVMSRKHKDFIMFLPEPIALKILSYLSTEEVDRARKVSPKWKMLVKSDAFWKFKLENIGANSF
jgi:hypothetical protein